MSRNRTCSVNLPVFSYAQSKYNCLDSDSGSIYERRDSNMQLAPKVRLLALFTIRWRKRDAEISVIFQYFETNTISSTILSRWSSYEYDSLFYFKLDHEHFSLRCVISRTPLYTTHQWMPETQTESEMCPVYKVDPYAIEDTIGSIDRLLTN